MGTTHATKGAKNPFICISYRAPIHLEDHTVNKAGAVFKSVQRDGCCVEFKIERH